LQIIFIFILFFLFFLFLLTFLLTLITYSQVLFFALSCDSPDLNFNNRLRRWSLEKRKVESIVSEM